MTATLNTIASSSPSLIIASRESRLALWQAEHIRNRLSQLHPSRSISILGMSTRGDRILDRPLAAIGGKGLFIKELEVAMQNGQAHLAVHSMKDVPMQMPEGFLLAAITEREDPRDALISNRYESLGALPPGAIVGTASLRREACLRARFPGLDIRPLRGNLDTRLRKLDAGEFDAIILAGAGLIRLGLKERIRAFLPLEESIPAPGQGALGIEIYNEAADAEAIRAAVEPLGHRPTMLCVCAERAFSLALGGSCQLPLGAYADIHGDTIRLNGFVALRDGSRVLEDRLERQVDNETEAALLGRTLAAELLRRGAGEILAAQV